MWSNESVWWPLTWDGRHQRPHHHNHCQQNNTKTKKEQNRADPSRARSVDSIGSISTSYRSNHVSMAASTHITGRRYSDLTCNQQTGRRVLGRHQDTVYSLSKLMSQVSLYLPDPGRQCSESHRWISCDIFYSSTSFVFLYRHTSVGKKYLFYFFS